MKIYLAGPMTGIPLFNFPKFMRVAGELRAKGHTVFNPAERDIERHGTDISVGNLTGSPEQAKAEHGLTIRDALHDDLVFITKNADAIFLMNGWEHSNGALSEFFTAKAIRAQFMYEPPNV